VTVVRFFGFGGYYHCRQLRDYSSLAKFVIQHYFNGSQQVFPPKREFNINQGRILSQNLEIF